MPRRSSWRWLVAALLCLPSVLAARTPVEVAPGVYALIADLGDVSRENHGVVGNLGFIVGDRAVLVVDGGVSYRFGEHLRATIAAVTPAAVSLVVITDPIQEFHFGTAAFQDQGIPVMAHRDAAALIAQRCATCLERLRATLGDDEMARSRVVVPDRLIDASTAVTVGDRVVDVLYLGGGSAPGNLALFDRRSGVLFAGGLVSLDRVPRLRDGDLPVWIAALQALAKLPATRIVPGHGPVATPHQARRTLAYLRALDIKVRSLYAQGVGLSNALRQADLPEFRGWSLYATLHFENVQELYLRIERADLRRDP